MTVFGGAGSRTPSQTWTRPAARSLALAHPGRDRSLHVLSPCHPHTVSMLSPHCPCAVPTRAVPTRSSGAQPQKPSLHWHEGLGRAAAPWRWGTRAANRAQARPGQVGPELPALLPRPQGSQSQREPPAPAAFGSCESQGQATSAGSRPARGAVVVEVHGSHGLWGGNAELPALSYTSSRRSPIAQSIRFRIKNKAEVMCFKQKSPPWRGLPDFSDQPKKEM